MNRNRLRYLGRGLGALLLLLVAAGCGPRMTRVEQGNAKQILHAANGAEPQEIDPQVVSGVPEHKLCMAVFEGLVSENPKDLSPEPGVAERWDISPDGRVYTFHLRANARWSDGEPVTAEDFVAAYERMLSPKLAAEYSYMLWGVQGAEEYNKGKLTDFSQVGFKAVNPQTLQITLASPVPYFLSLLTHNSWYPVPVKVIRRHGDPYSRGNQWTRPGNFVGNGPFVLKDWKVNSHIQVVKSPTYWDADRVRLKEIFFYPIESAEVEERAFRSGLLHFTTQVPSTKIQVYQKNEPQFLRIDPIVSTYFYRLNVTRKPFQDKRVRQALAMALQRKEIVEHVTRGGQIPAFHYTPPNTAGYTAQARVHENVEKARELLAQAGYPNGKGFPSVELLFNTSESHRSIAEAIQEMWRRNLNIEVQLVNMEWKTFLDNSKKLNYDICRAGWNADFLDPNTFLDMFVTNGGNNETGWSNAEYDRLIQEAARTGDRDQRYAVFQKAEAILMEELPIIPIYYYTRPYLIQPSVKGWHPTLLDHHPYKYLYLEAQKEGA